MRIYLLFILFTAFCFADIPFHVKQEKIKLPGQELELGVEGNTSNIEVILYKVTNPQAFLQTQKDLHKLKIEETEVRNQLNKAIEDSQKENKPRIQGTIAAQNTNFEFTTFIKKPKWTNTAAEYKTLALGIKEAGLYIAEVQSKNYVAYALLNSSKIAMITRRSNNKVVSYVVDRKTGKPFAQAEVSVYQNGTLLQTTKTTSAGIAYFQVLYSPQIMVIATTEEHVTVDDPLFFPSLVDVEKCFVFTERPLYLPEEEVYFKGVLRQQQQDIYAIPSDFEVEYQVQDAQGTVFFKDKTISQQGAFSGTIKLPSTIALGTCILQCKVGQKSFQTQFQAEKFQKPKFVVQVVPDQKAILMGDKVEFAISCRYYAGGDVLAGKVNYELYMNQFEQPLFQTVGLDQFYSVNEFRSFKPELVKNGSASLENGKLSLTFPTTKQPLSYNYQLKVSIYDTQRNTAFGSGRAKVEPYPVKFDAKTNKELFALEEQIVVQVKAVDINGKGIKSPFKVQALRKDRYVVGNNNSEKTKIVGVSSSKKFFEITGTTNEEGDGIVEIPAALTGAIDVVIRSTQNDAQITKTVWVSEGAEPLMYSGESIFIVPDKKIYQLGDTAKVLVVFPMKEASPFISVEGTDILDYSVAELDINNHVISIPITKAMSPNFYVRVAAIYKNGFIEGEKMLVVPPAHKIIQLEITGNKEQYGPGEEATFDIVARDYEGNPISTDLSLAIVDASIYAIASDSNAALSQFFYPLRRQNVGVSSSIDLLSYDYAQIAERLEEPVVEKLMEKMNKLLDFGNGFGDTGVEEVENEAPELERRMESLSRADDDNITGGGAVFEDSEGAEHDEDMAGDDVAMDVAVANTQSRQPGESRPEPETQKKKDKPSDEKPQSKENARQFFKTTALWQAFVQTNSEGKAQVKCKFPDNLSDWQITARAIDKNTKIGEIVTSTSTRKPVMVTLAHPKFLVVGDKANVSLGARNATSETLDMSLQLTSSPEIAIEKTGNNEGKVAPNAWLYQNVSMTATKSGIAELYAAVDSKHKDGEVKKISVIPHGIMKSFGYAGKVGNATKHAFALTEEADISSARLVVRVSPGFLSATRESLGMLMEYPYGCAEQTMSRFMPNLVASDVFLRLGENVDKNILDKNVKAGLLRMQQLQNQDGGWGWWQEDNVSHPLLSAYVVTGLAHSKRMGYSPEGKTYDNAISFLKNILNNNSLQYDEQAYIIYALAMAQSLPEGMADKIFDRKERLQASSYTLSLLILTLMQEDRKAEAKILLAELLEQSKISGDSLPFWGDVNGRQWSKNAVEITALAVRAILAVDPEQSMIKPTLEWLMSQRKDRGWNSTKDTSEVILTFCDYLALQKENSTQMAHVKIQINGNFYDMDTTKEGVVCEARKLTLQNELQITATGSNEYLYYTAYLEYFTNEKPITSASAGIDVTRSYYKLESADKSSYQRKFLEGNLSADDLIMVELDITCHKDSEFVMLEDYIPATAVVMSKDREMTVDGVSESKYTHREFHDEKTVFFFTSLTQGKHKVHYFFRPSLAGTYHALPAIASLMYYPEVRGNSNENIITVD